MRFKARRDWFFIGLFVLNLVLAGIIIITLLNSSIDFISVLLSILLCVELIFISLMFFNCYYEVNSDKIKLVIGIISIDIKIKDINAIYKCHNYIFSFALSGKRLELNFGTSRAKKRNKFYISPKDEAGFIEQVCKHNEFKGVVDEDF